MQVAIHLGAHCTDDNVLLRTLLRNKGQLAKSRVSVPGPSRYRHTVVRAAQKLRGDAASIETRDMLIDAVVDDEEADRLIMTYDDFMCVPGRVFEKGVLYDKAGYKPTWLRNLFPEMAVEFFLAIRNPATFIPAVFANPRQTTDDFHAFLNGVDLDQIRWSDVILSIRETNPDCPITVWCNEDTPIIWPQIVREIAGIDPLTPIVGAMRVLNSIMKPEGMKRLRTYLDSHPPHTEIQRRRVVVAFLDKYALEDAIEEELDVPGWTEQLVTSLTQNYEDDLDEIARLPGVNFIVP